MLFNPDSSKLAQEVRFLRKTENSSLYISLNTVKVERVSYEKRLDIFLGEKILYFLMKNSISNNILIVLSQK